VLGLVGFHVFDINRTLKNEFGYTTEVTDQQLDETSKMFAKQKEKAAFNSPYFGIAKGKNVLIVQLESFQNYVIGKKINGREITPNLNKLVNSDVLYFNNFHHQVGQGRTSDAEFLVNNSLYPLPTGSVYVRYPKNQFDSLPKILKQSNYHTMSFHAFEKSFWNRQVMYKNMHFDRFYSKEDFSKKEEVGWALGDYYFFDETVNYLQKAPQPFYGFAVALSSHHPFDKLPAKYRTLNFGPYEGTTWSDYLSALHYVDYSVGELIKKLKETGLWENTVVMMYGDHDSGIPMDEKMAKFIGESPDELNREMLIHRVPFIMHIPGLKEKGTHSQAVGMIDVTPTVLHLLGISDPTGHHLGVPFFDGKNHMLAFRNGSGIDGNLYFKASIDGVFTRGKCFSFKTHKEVSIEKCRALAGEIDYRLKNSDLTIQNNLLARFHEDKKTVAAP
jgi:hypothetical protein